MGLVVTQHPRLGARLRPGEVRPEALLAGSERALQRRLGLRREDAKVIFSGNFPARARAELEACRRVGIEAVTFDDPAYEDRLRNLSDPPACLYVRGTLPKRGTRAVAVVGARRATPYGVRVAEKLGGELAERGVTVISGLARGIDTAAHRGALESGGQTVAVLGSGLNFIYPRENKRIYEQISEAGALVTEYPLGTPPRAHHFPVRNRMIAALSEAVVVVEAARNSGSLITAGLAADQMGIPVCAVPGRITSQTSEGCNDLIYDGATPVRTVQDVLDLLPGFPREPETGRDQRAGGRPPADLGPGPLRVLEALDPEAPRSADDLVTASGLASGALLGHLLELEMRGLARQLPGGLFVRRS